MFAVDIGSFGPVTADSNDPYFHNKKIDELIDDVGGIKTFYSDVLYSKAYMHDRYNGRTYNEMKSKYDSVGRFPNLFEKVRNSDAKEDSL